MRRVAFFAALLVAALAFAAPAHALTRDEATAIALETLKPELETGPVVLFGLPETLGPKQSVIEASPSRLGNVPAKRLAKLKKTVWLFWEDFAPGAGFQHASRLLLVDDATGAVARDAGLSWYPLVDGRIPPFLLTQAGYEDPEYVVFTNLETGPAPPAVGPLRALLPRATAPPEGTFKDDCLLMVGLVPQPDKPGEKKETRTKDAVDKTLSGLAAAAEAAGVPAYYATTDGPSDKPPASNDKQVNGTSRPEDPEGQKSLSYNVDFLVKKKKCKDVYLYILGHGVAEKDSTQNGVPLKGGPPQVVVGQKKHVTANDLVKIVKAHKEGTKAPATFKVLIDSCYAERVKELVFTEPNVWIAFGAARKDEQSIIQFGSKVKLVDKDGKPVTAAVPNGGATEFGHWAIEGFKEIVNNAAALDKAVKAGGSTLGQVLKAMFALTGKYDRASVAINPATGKPYATPIINERLPAVAEEPKCEGKTRNFAPGRPAPRAPAGGPYEFIATFHCDEAITLWYLSVETGVITAFLSPLGATCTQAAGPEVGRPIRALAGAANTLRCTPNVPVPADAEVEMNVRVSTGSAGDVTVQASPDNGATYVDFTLVPEG
jgi:hypothetical protein